MPSPIIPVAPVIIIFLFLLQGLSAFNHFPKHKECILNDVMLFFFGEFMWRKVLIYTKYLIADQRVQ